MKIFFIFDAFAPVIKSVTSKPGIECRLFRFQEWSGLASARQISVHPGKENNT
jgi:hypothetical protein